MEPSHTREVYRNINYTYRSHYLPLCLPVSLSLSYTCTHTCSHTHTHTHTHAQAHAHAHTLTHTCTHTRIHLHAPHWPPGCRVSQLSLQLQDVEKEVEGVVLDSCSSTPTWMNDWLTGCFSPTAVSPLSTWLWWLQFCLEKLYYWLCYRLFYWIVGRKTLISDLC